MSTDVVKTANFFNRPNKYSIPFAANALATVLTSLIVVGSSSAYAAENRSVDEIQSEVARLKELLSRTEQELQSATSGNAAIAENNAVSNDAVNNTQLVQNTVSVSTKNEAEGTSSDIQEVLIRAERIKTLKAVHDEPASISVVTADDLHLELASDYQAITKRLANVTFNQSNTRGASLSIRGIGKRGFAEVQDPSVLVALDGVSFGLTALGNFDFYDIETVEAQRGVTGTTGGKGGSAGQVSYTTKRPSFTPSAEFSVTYGQRNTEILSAAVGGPIIDDLLAWRGAIYVDKGDGYYKNQYGYDDNNNTYYNRARNAARIQFLLTPTSDFSARLSFDSQPKATQLENGLTFRHDQPLTYANGTLTDPNGTTARSKLAGFTNAAGVYTAPRAWFTERPSSETPGRNFTAGDYNVEDGNGILASNEYQGQYLSTKGTSLDLNWDFDNFKVNSLTAYRDFYFDAHNDDVTSFDISKQGGGSVIYDQYSQEISIKSKPGGVIEYQAGLYAIKTKDDVQSRTSWGSDAGAWNASTVQYNTLERTAGVNRGAGLALLKDSLEDAYKKADIYVDTQSNAIYGSLDWHETEKATLTTGLRVGTEDRSSRDVNLLLNNGSGGALNPVSVNALQPIALGGFNSTAAGLLGTNSVTQLNTADSVAYKYYGATITSTPGAAYNSLTSEQKAQVAAAKAIRNAGIGLLYPSVTDNYEDTLYTGNISQSYKFSEELTAYGTLQHGEKSGTAFNISGVNAPVKAEKTDAIELGIKTFLFDNTFTFNVDIYRLNIHNYQQAIRVPDVYQIALNQSNGIETPVPPYTTAQGNLSKVIAQGIEFDGIYSGIDNFTFRFSGAYNDAHYADYPNAPLPAEEAYKSAQGILFVDRSGESLPGAPKYTFNVGAQYRKPVGNYEVHSSVNAAYTGSYNNGDDFSTYTKIKGYWITDVSLGIAAPSNKFDLNLVVKNITDEAPHEEAWTTYEPYIYRRWVGVEFSGKF
ncbi:MAG: TonB-dependent receptor [Gammaproteobacteria bacterium]|nr:MAG: TonB-dependent receptor [Gammaproteobacteria bacterium]